MKKFTLSLSAFLIFLSFFAYSQLSLDTAWTISRDGGMDDEAWSIAADDSNYFYWATFQLENSVKQQFVLYKLDENGQQIWESKHYGITWWNRAFTVKEKGNYIYAAGTGAINGVLNGPIDAVIICYRKSNGDTVWMRHYNQGFGYEEVDGMELMQDAIYMTGWTKSAGGAAQQDILVLKMDYNGNFLDTAIWGSPGFDEANGEMVIDDSTIYIAGRWNASGAASLFDGDGLVASFNRSDLSFKDSVLYDSGNFMDDALGLASDGTYLYAVGYSTNFGNSQQMTIWKYDKQLNLLWDTAWGGPGNEFARGIVKSSDGNMLIAGNISVSPGAPADIFLMKMKTDGDILWYKTMVTDSMDLSHNLIEKNGDIYITGNSKSTGHNNYDAWLLKVRNVISGTREKYELPEDVNEFRIFPNLNSDEFIVRLAKLSADSIQLKEDPESGIHIFDDNGREIYYTTLPATGTVKITTENWHSGIYFVRWHDWVRKFIKSW